MLPQQPAPRPRLYRLRLQCHAEPLAVVKREGNNAWTGLVMGLPETCQARLCLRAFQLSF